MKRSYTSPSLRSLLVWWTVPLMVMVSPAAAVASDAGSVVSAKIDPVPLYASPDEANPAKTAPASSLPWHIKETHNDFYRVSIDGKDYWVDSMTVHASKTVVAACGRSAGGVVIAADLGASTNHCK
ncbi:hypothetical protein [Paraburkholderia sartisoli]|uniref:Uncharacterized protein n=1 Tax=Paraburkholderia sartisoli TaxID=83784 RepID=A0A1H4GJ56_9BURK|nr:hypothetical protein [Paraburkholderia sartisoli]SEB09659.1 hypothetical protein SAMN05192564_10684 [Paraburkholderia sartisoli]